MAQPVEHPTWAQVMISQFVSSSPTSGSMQSLLGILSLPLFAPPLLMLALSLSKINTKGRLGGSVG